MQRDLRIQAPALCAALLLATLCALPLSRATPSLTALPAIELSWADAAQNTAVEVSPDGEAWSLIAPTRQDGSRSYWITPLQDAPRFARGASSTQTQSRELNVEVSQETRQLRIEIYNETEDRWETQILAQLEGEKTQYPFTLRQITSVSKIRIFASQQSLFSFPFSSRAARPTAASPVALSPILGYTSATTNDARLSAETAVEESDIWKLHGDRLFFFNRLRGLQVLDLSNKEAPQIAYRLKIPGYGQELYAPDSETAILLTQERNSQSSKIRTLAIEGDTLKIKSVFELPGRIIDSRKIGDRIYTISQQYEYTENNGYGYYRRKNEIKISAIDFSDLERPQIVREFTIADQNAIITATPTHLLVASYSWRHSTINHSDVFVFAIGQASNPLKPIQAFSTAGRITDKFKMGVSSNFITTISYRHSRRTTILETFRLNASAEEIELPANQNPTPLPHAPLGRLEVGKNESLFATRILQNKAYIVTFRQVDPLWVIDLSDPAAPSVSGELEIPGWSSYLQPIGDQLFSVGVEESRVALSLFDVSNPATPFLSDRIYLGEEGTRSWSEANYDEKAISIFPDKGLALLPFQSSAQQSWYASRATHLQAVQFENGKLALAGTIASKSLPRRATLQDDALISVSERELLIFDATDPAQPQYISQLDLSWDVDQLFQQGEYLLQIETGQNQRFTSENSTASIRVSTIDDTEKALSKISLGDALLAGIAYRDQMLFCLLSELPPYSGVTPSPEKPEPTLTLAVYDVSNPLGIERLSTSEFSVSSSSFLNYSPLWLDEQTLVWHSTPAVYWGWRFFDFPYYGGSPTGASIEFHSFHISPAAPPIHLARFSLKAPSDLDENSGTNEALGGIYHWNPNPFGKIISSKNRVFVGSRSQRFSNTQYLTSYQLTAVNFAHPSTPAADSPADLPGAFIHLYENDQGGTLIFTQSSSYQNINDTYQNQSSIQASVYFESQAFEVAHFDFPLNHYPTVEFHKKTFFAQVWSGVSDSLDDAETPPLRRSIQRIHFNTDGAFEKREPLIINSNISQYRVIKGNLFVLHRDDFYTPAQLTLFDASDLGPDPESQTLETESAYHDLNSLNLSDNRLLFALRSEGAFTYPFQPYIESQIARAALHQSAPATSWVQLSSQSLTSADLDTPVPADNWALLPAQSLYPTNTHDLDQNNFGANPLDFRTDPAIQFHFESETGEAYSIFHSNELKTWTLLESFVSDGQSRTYPYPIFPNSHRFLKVE